MINQETTRLTQAQWMTVLRMLEMNLVSQDLADSVYWADGATPKQKRKIEKAFTRYKEIRLGAK